MSEQIKDLTNLSHIITEQAARIRELEAQILAERKCLRDEFAMASLSGLLAELEHSSIDLVAVDAYCIADAMMERRK